MDKDEKDLEGVIKAYKRNLKIISLHIFITTSIASSDRFSVQNFLERFPQVTGGGSSQSWYQMKEETKAHKDLVNAQLES